MPMPPSADLHRPALPSTTAAAAVPADRAVATPAPPSDMLSHAELTRAVDRALADCRRRGRRVSVLAVQVTSLTCLGEANNRHEPPLRTEGSVLDSFLQRLRGGVRHGDQLLRLDERTAAVILPGAGDAEAALVDTRLSRLVSGVYRHQDQLLQLETASGRSSYPELGVRGRELVLAAIRPLRWRERQ